jgi:hypothetical protein
MKHRDPTGQFCLSPGKQRAQARKEAWIMRNREAAAKLGQPRIPSVWHWSRDGISAACGQVAAKEQLLSGDEFVALDGCPGCQALYLASTEWQAIRNEVMKHVDNHATSHGYPQRNQRRAT